MSSKINISNTLQIIRQDDNEESLASQIECLFDNDIKLNIVKLKKRCLYYMRKIYYIFETNFIVELQSIIEEKKQNDENVDSKEYRNLLDPFKLIYNAHRLSHSVNFKDTLMKECFTYETNSIFKDLPSKYFDQIEREIRLKKVKENASDFENEEAIQLSQRTSAKPGSSDSEDNI